MRILAFYLRAFGPFTGVVLDLSGGSEGLHVIYGPNEAGKTSALRGLEQFFFGIPVQSSDNFIHPHPKLRIGARLRGSDGKELECFRRKGAKNTLLDSDGRTPLDEIALTGFLQGLDHGTFTTMFGLDHERLEAGGLDIAHGRGALGESLFAAGAGISNLYAVRRDLETEADTLFRPRGATRTINRHFAALKETRKAIRQAQLPSSQWVEQEDALQAATERLGEVEAELGRACECCTRTERIQDALPLVGRHKEFLRRQAALGSVPLLPDDLRDQRREADATLRVARKQQETAREAIRQIDDQVESLSVPEDLLGESSVIEATRETLGGHRKAQEDLPKLMVQREHLEIEAGRILGEIDPDLSIEQVDRLRLTSRQKVEIQNLGSRHESLVKQLGRAENEIDDCRRELDEAKRAFADLPSPRNARMLKDTVRRIQARGDLEQQRAEAAADLQRQERQAAVDLEKLPHWSGSLEELEKRPVPGLDTIDLFDDRFVRCIERLKRLERDRREVTDQKGECREKIEKLTLAGSVPTEQELLEARRVRDAGWQLVVRAWRKMDSGGSPAPAPSPDAARAFLDRFEAADLADAYPKAVERSDELADRLRREAARVTELATVRASENSLSRRLVDLADEEARAEAQRREAEKEWAAAWEPAGIRPRPPRVMRAWLQRQRELVAQAEAIRMTHGRVEQLTTRAAGARDELGRALAELHEPAPTQVESLGAILGRSQGLVDVVEDTEARREQLSHEQARLGKRLETAETTRKRAERDLHHWRDAWALAVEPLRLPPHATPAEANEVLARIGDLFGRLSKADDLGARIEGIRHDADRFGEEVRLLVGRVASDLERLDVEQQVEAVSARLRKADRSDKERRLLLEQRKGRVLEREDAQRTIDSETARLDTMCQEACCAGHDDLPEAIMRSEEKKQLRDEVARLEEQLRKSAAGATVEDFVAEVEAVDADRLPAELDQFAETIGNLETERKELLEKRGALQNGLATIDTDAAAANASEEAESLVAQIESDARHYARLRLASAVLIRAIDRYREKVEGPVLRRASDLFSKLTLGSFESLRTDVDKNGQTVLVGVRPGCDLGVHVGGMSDGTCDQLYLALRLASLEQHLEAAAPVPFVVDDILIRFDDDRAAATLDILAELSRKTQVLFFTHHQHLVGLAQERLDESVCFVHHLPSRHASADALGTA